LFGSWHWNLDQQVSTEGHSPVVDLSQGNTVVNINTVSMNKGDFFPKETQLLRINGVSMPGSAPFSINEEGKSVLSKEWEAPIEALYETVLVPEQTQTVPAEENNVTELQIAAAPAQEEVYGSDTAPVSTALSEERRAYVEQIASLIMNNGMKTSATETQDVGGQGLN